MNTWNGEHYKKHSQVQAQRALKVIEQISFRGDERVLDIGCGDGQITKIISDKTTKGKVIGIDISDSMIQQANKEYAHIKNLSFKQDNAEDFRFNEKFDLITSFNALHWVKNHEKTISNIKNSLNSKGKICFLLASGQRNLYIDQVLFSKAWETHFKKLDDFHKTMISINYNDLLIRHSFIIDSLVVKDKIHQFKTIHDLEQHLMTWVPSVTELPKKICQTIAREIAKNIAKNTNPASDSFSYSISMLHVLAHLI